MLSVPLKGAVASGPSISATLSKYVARTYSPALADSHKAQFAAVAAQRLQVVSICSKALSPLSVGEASGGDAAARTQHCLPWDPTQH